MTDKEGNLIAVASVALCRAGAVEGMDFVEAPLSGGISSALSGIVNQEGGLKPAAPILKGQRAMDYKALLLKILGLGEDATDEAIQAALDKAAAQKPTQEEKKTEFDAAVKAAVAEAMKPIEAKVAALSAAAEAHEKADLVAEAAREGWRGRHREDHGRGLEGHDREDACDGAAERQDARAHEGDAACGRGERGAQADCAQLRGEPGDIQEVKGKP